MIVAPRLQEAQSGETLFEKRETATKTNSGSASQAKNSFEGDNIQDDCAFDTTLRRPMADPPRKSDNPRRRP